MKQMIASPLYVKVKIIQDLSCYGNTTKYRYIKWINISEEEKKTVYIYISNIFKYDEVMCAYKYEMKSTLCHMYAFFNYTWYHGSVQSVTSHRCLTNLSAGITDRYYYHCSENCDIDFCQVGLGFCFLSVDDFNDLHILHWLQSCLSRSYGWHHGCFGDTSMGSQHPEANNGWGLCDPARPSWESLLG